MTAREWLPDEYLDEVTPPWRASPDDWIDEVHGWIAVLGPVENEVEGAYQMCVAVGDVVQFVWQELVAEIELAVWEGGYSLLGEAPPAGTWTRVCTSLANGGIVEQSIDKVVDEIRDEERLADPEWPVRVIIFFYLDNMWRERSPSADQFRLIDQGGALAFVPARQLS